MALTEKQKYNIQQLSTEDAIEVLYTCIERLGVVSQNDYRKIMAYQFSRQNLIQDMQKGKIMYVKISGIRYPIINY